MGATASAAGVGATAALSRPADWNTSGIAMPAAAVLCEGRQGASAACDASGQLGAPAGRAGEGANAGHHSQATGTRALVHAGANTASAPMGSSGAKGRQRVHRFLDAPAKVVQPSAVSESNTLPD
jgi:hypothetical protein